MPDTHLHDFIGVLASNVVKALNTIVFCFYTAVGRKVGIAVKI